MATAKTDKPQDTADAPAANSPGFGAYGGVATSLPDLTMAVDRMPESKVKGSLDFTDSDKRWLKELGITTTDPNSFHRVWESDQERYKSQHRTWANTYGGRLGMRAISRGIVGAAFYAAGNMYSAKQMEGYNLHEDPENVLQHIARFIDNTAGRAVQFAVKTYNHGKPDAEEKALKSVLFRDTIDYGNKFHNTSLKGRSLGHEAVGVTFDFASMSFGDYMTRYVLGLFDPNAKKHWIKNGHLDIPGGLKDVLTNVFRGVTYAAGEDMAVALPYVYGMRAQRYLLNKASPGFKYDSDLSLNGGSFKVRNDRVVGDYHLEGMADLMGRFSWYNVGTKMFRDAYGHLTERFDQFKERWKHGDHSMPHVSLDPRLKTPGGIVDAASDAARYVIRTTTKVMAYMLPATTFFYLSRTPQSKVRGVAIDGGEMIDGKLVGEKGVLMYDKVDLKDVSGVDETGYAGRERVKRLTAGSNYNNNVKLDTLYWKRADGEISRDVTRNPFDSPTRSREEVFKNGFYDQGKDNWYSKPLNKIGKVSYDYGTKVNEAAQSTVGFLRREFPRADRYFSQKDPKSIEKFSRLYANAALAYTPYFMMKTDVLSAEWDTERTDMALNRTLDGISHLNWGEFRAGMGEVLRAMMREPFTDPSREAMAQRLRWGYDPEHRSNEAYQLNLDTPTHTSRLGRRHSGESFANEGLKSKKVTPETLTQLKPVGTSWTTQEAMRQFRDSNPDGQSVH